MSNETKREVLKRALDFFVATGLVRNINYNLESYQYLSEYDAALPDDLPVIPKEVGEYIEWAKDNELSLVDAMRWQVMPDWVLDHSDTFALAWLLGEWEVEE